MFKCNNCQATFEAPETKNIAAESYLGIDNLFPTRTRMDVYVCPSCGDDDLEELKQCGICQEWLNEDELYDTTEYINGGCGMCCEQCICDADMIEI